KSSFGLQPAEADVRQFIVVRRMVEQKERDGRLMPLPPGSASLQRRPILTYLACPTHLRITIETRSPPRLEAALKAAFAFFHLRALISKTLGKGDVVSALITARLLSAFKR